MCVTEIRSSKWIWMSMFFKPISWIQMIMFSFGFCHTFTSFSFFLSFFSFRFVAAVKFLECVYFVYTKILLSTAHGQQTYISKCISNKQTWNISRLFFFHVVDFKNTTILFVSFGIPWNDRLNRIAHYVYRPHQQKWRQ